MDLVTLSHIERMFLHPQEVDSNRASPPIFFHVGVQPTVPKFFSHRELSLSLFLHELLALALIER